MNIQIAGSSALTLLKSFNLPLLLIKLSNSANLICLLHFNGLSILVSKLITVSRFVESKFTALKTDQKSFIIFCSLSSPIIEK